MHMLNGWLAGWLVARIASCIWKWFGHGLEMVWKWFGNELEMNWTWFGNELDMV
jgi:hypothetical protein